MAYSRGHRLEDDDGEALGQPAGVDSWEDRDCPQRAARTDRDVADIRTLIRLGGDLVPSQVVASCRFRLSAHVARIEKAKRTTSTRSRSEASGCARMASRRRRCWSGRVPCAVTSWYGWGLALGGPTARMGRAAAFMPAAIPASAGRWTRGITTLRWRILPTRG